MLKGKSILELATEVQRQHEQKSDYMVPTDKMEFVARSDDNGKPNYGVTLGDSVELGVNNTFHAQLGTQLQIPAKYYARLREDEPQLLAENINTLLHREPPKNRLVRTLDGNARAYLSEGYRPLDNFDLLEAILPVIAEKGLVIKSSEVTESKLYIEAVSERITGEVKKDDIVQAGVVISNSEVGQGSLRCEDFLFRLWCLNGCITGDALKKNHVGRGKAGILDDVAAYYRPSTRRLDDAAFFSKVQDTVSNIFEQGGFEKYLSKFRRAAGDILTDPEAAIETVVRKLDLTEGEGSGVLKNLIAGGDLTLWGLSNAVTALAHDAANYDRNIELQRMGSQVISLPKSDWREVVAFAA